MKVRLFEIKLSKKVASDPQTVDNLSKKLPFKSTYQKKKEENVRTLSVLCTELVTQILCGDAERGLVVTCFFYNGKLGIDLMTSNPLSWEKEVPIVLELISFNPNMLNGVLTHWCALL